MDQGKCCFGCKNRCASCWSTCPDYQARAAQRREREQWLREQNAASREAQQAVERIMRKRKKA